MLHLPENPQKTGILIKNAGHFCSASYFTGFFSGGISELS
jgi:hypothetical protein